MSVKARTGLGLTKGGEMDDLKMRCIAKHYAFIAIGLLFQVGSAGAGELLPFPNSMNQQYNYNQRPQSQIQNQRPNSAYPEKFVNQISTLNCAELNSLKQRFIRTMNSINDVNSVDRNNYAKLIGYIDNARFTRRCK